MRSLFRNDGTVGYNKGNEGNEGRGFPCGEAMKREEGQSEHSQGCRDADVSITLEQSFLCAAARGHRQVCHAVDVERGQGKRGEGNHIRQDMMLRALQEI